MVEYKHGHEGLMYKSGETDDTNYISDPYYSGNKDAFNWLYGDVIKGVNEFDIYSQEQLIMLNELHLYKPKATFKGTIEELNAFMFENAKEFKL